MEPPRAGGRIFGLPMRPMLADCAPSGRIRLDALARWVQDVAYADIEDAGLESAAVWVIRRTSIRVQRFPRFGERFRVETFASGIGRMWAERRTTVRPITSDESAEPAAESGLRQWRGPLRRKGHVWEIGRERHNGQAADHGADDLTETPVVEAATIWIHLDPVRRVPTPLTQSEISVYADAAGDRRFSHRLAHPKPDQMDALSESAWTFRRSDLDLADHVNNAAYWEPLEEELLVGPEPGPIDAEIEYRVPAQPGPVRVLSGGCYRWLADPASDEVLASMMLMNARTTSGSN